LATTNKNFKVKNGLDVGGNTVITGDANVTGKLSVTARAGDEGGEIFLSNAATNTTITNGVTIDVYQDQLRFFEQGGDARGYFINIATGGGAASTNLVGGGGGGTASNSFATVSANGTSVVAESSADTLTITPGDGLSITGNATSDTITFTPNIAGASANGIVTTGTQTFAGEKTFSNTITASANIIANTGYVSADAFRLDTTYTSGPSQAGEITWDPDNETAQLQLDAHTIVQIGQEQVLRVKNSDGANAIPIRTAVMFAGADGDTVTVARANSANITVYPSDYMVGITAEEIAADGVGFVTQFGILPNVNTAAFTLGNLLYVDPTNPGQFVTTRPSAPAWQTPIAAVTKVGSGSSGRILVRTIPGISINHVEGVEITSATENDVLRVNANGIVVNSNLATAGIANLSGATFTGNVAGTNANLSGNVTINGTTSLGLAETQKVVDVRTPVDAYTLANNTYTINLASGNYFSNITTQRLYNSSSGWTIVGTNTYSTNLTATSPLTYTLISSGTTAQGDVAIVMVTTDSGTNALPTVNLTASPGWTTNSAAATTYGSAVFYKTLGATPDTTIVLNYGATDVTAVASIVIRSSDILPVYVSAITTPTRANNTSGVPAPPATTTTIANTLVVTAGSLRNDIVDATASATGPTGYSNYTLATSGNVAGTAAASMLATKFVANVGTETPTAFAPKFANTVAVSDQWSAWTFQVAAYLDPTITLSNSATGTYPASTYVLHINNPSNVTTTTWAGITYSWQNGTAPTLSSGTYANNLVILETIDGTNFKGALSDSYA